MEHARASAEPIRSIFTEEERSQYLSVSPDEQFEILERKMHEILPDMPPKDTHPLWMVLIALNEARARLLLPSMHDHASQCRYVLNALMYQLQHLPDQIWRREAEKKCEQYMHAEDKLAFLEAPAAQARISFLITHMHTSMAEEVRRLHFMPCKDGHLRFSKS